MRSWLWALALVTPLAWSQGLVVTPAWSGHYVVGRATEIGILVTSPVGGAMRVSVTGGMIDLDYRANIEAERPWHATLPYAPGPDGGLEVTVELPDATGLSQTVALLPRRDRFLVQTRALGSVPPSPATSHGRQLAGPDSFPTSSDRLPRSVAGYQPVAALKLRPMDLASLDHDQLRALAGHLLGCGPVELVEATPELLDRIRVMAGCGGRFVTSLPTEEADPLPESRTGGTRPWSDDAEVRSLLESRLGRDPRVQVALLMLPYPIALMALAGGRRVGGWLMLVPAAAAFAYAWILPATTLQATAATWAEMEAGDPGYRFVTLLELRGNGRSNADFRLPAGAGILSAIDADSSQQRVTVRMSDPDGSVALPIPADMFHHSRYRLHGTARAPWALDLEPSTRGVGITNRGPQETPAGWLGWLDVAYEIPALPSGASYRIHAGDRSAATPERSSAHGFDAKPNPWPLIRNHTKDPVLLLPLTPGHNQDRHRSETGWLLIRSRRKTS